VNGATGTAGRLAVQIAKSLGARKVVATGRNVEALQSLRGWGADVTIPLGETGHAFEEAVQDQFRDGGIDVVIDYLWGPSAERIIAAGAQAGPESVPIRFVQVGAMSAPTRVLPSAALRSSALTLLGSGISSIPMDRLVRSIGDMLHAAVPGHFQIATKTFPLSAVEHVWATEGNQPRTVFLIP
jgi:NADPH:quinone reductase-like Zn-dependent oxidoreductase